MRSGHVAPTPEGKCGYVQTAVLHRISVVTR